MRPQDTQPEPAATGTVAGDRRVKISAVRRATARAMVDSAFTAPHATEFLTVDLTESMQLVEKLRKHPVAQGREAQHHDIDFVDRHPFAWNLPRAELAVGCGQ